MVRASWLRPTRMTMRFADHPANKVSDWGRWHQLARDGHHQAGTRRVSVWSRSQNQPVSGQPVGGTVRRRLAHTISSCAVGRMNPGSDAQALAAFGAARTDDCSTTAGFHPDQEAVGALAANH